MEELLYGFRSNDGSWVYYSLLLTIAVFFKFNRLWSLRNIDLMLLLSLSPALLLIQEGETRPINPENSGLDFVAIGYGWLFVDSLLVLTRLVLDSRLKRRPRLDQNLNVAGMLFLSISALLFLMAKAATEPPPQVTVETIERGQELLERVDKSVVKATEDDELHLPGPTNTAVASVSSALTDAVVSGDDKLKLQTIAVRIMSVLAHLAVISGLLFVGYQQFGDFQLGAAMVLLYLILPCTAFDFHRAHLVIPAALIVWAVAAYRRPTIAGILLGLAGGAVFFPVFLLPIWMMFFWKRGAKRFTGALVFTGVFLVSTLFFTSSDVVSFRNQLMGTIDWEVLRFGPDETAKYGFWDGESYAFRTPVFVVFLIMIIMMCLRSKQTLETLVADSAAIVVGTQFWYTSRGGVFVLWYLPLLLLVVFRPRLTHLVPPEFTSTDEKDVHLSRHGTGTSRLSQTGAQVLR